MRMKKRRRGRPGDGNWACLKCDQEGKMSREWPESLGCDIDEIRVLIDLKTPEIGIREKSGFRIFRFSHALKTGEFEHPDFGVMDRCRQFKIKVNVWISSYKILKGKEKKRRLSQKRYRWPLTLFMLPCPTSMVAYSVCSKKCSLNPQMSI